MESPHKRKTRGEAGFPEPPRFLSTVSCQSSAWVGWQREAVRLFGLYWRTGDLKHFYAFGRHIDAMRLHSRRHA